MAKKFTHDQLHRESKVAKIQNVRQLIVSRMKKRKLTAYALGKMVRTEMAEQSVREYVSGRSDMRGEKIAVLLAVLGLEVRDKE